MTDGKIEKMEKDWSAEVALGISKSLEFVKVLILPLPLSFKFDALAPVFKFGYLTPVFKSDALVLAFASDALVLTCLCV